MSLIMFDGNTMSLRYSFSSNFWNSTVGSDEQPLQFLELQLGHSSDQICRSSYQILQRTPSTLFADALFPFPLRHLNAPPFPLLPFLSSFNLSTATSNLIFNKIAAFARHLSAGNLDLNFHIIASVDFVRALWVDRRDRVPPASNAAAPASAIQRLMDLKFDGLGVDEFGDCTVCCDELDELDDREKEVTRITCGHVFHQSCILHWLHMCNSCPLCRTKLQH